MEIQAPILNDSQRPVQKQSALQISHIVRTWPRRILGVGRGSIGVWPRRALGNRVRDPFQTVSNLGERLLHVPERLPELSLVHVAPPRVTSATIPTIVHGDPEAIIAAF